MNYHPDQTNSRRDRSAIAISRPNGSTLRRILAALVLLAVVAVTPTTAVDASSPGRGSEVVVANRGSGDISVIDNRTLEVMSVDLPGEAEPMYVNHDRRHDRVLVGDRASSSIVAFDDDSYEVVGSVDVGDGVFHQWLENARRQLWVVGNTSNTVTVVDTRNLAVLTTIDIPAELVEAGGEPHDVFVNRNHAFVTVLGVGEEGSQEGVVLQYSTRTFAETGRVNVGDDPHVFVRGGTLYVASQDTSTIASFRTRDLHPLASAEVASAHGLFVTTRSEVLVTTIAGGGVDAVSELNGRLTELRDTVDTDFPVPHNITVDNRRQMFVTHSGGSADKVSVIRLVRDGFGEPETVTVGLNPFGLAFVR
ncbi:MAG: YncE family protein [Acidimicrobiales bacterium]